MIFQKILLIFTLLSLNSFAQFKYVIKVKNQTVLSQIKKTIGSSSISKMYSGKTNLFKNHYELNSSNPRIYDILTQNKNITLVEKIYEIPTMGIVPSNKNNTLIKDELFGYQWSLFNQEQILTQQISTVKSLETLGLLGIDIGWYNTIEKIESSLKKTPIVAVLDMGVDLDHPELKEQILINESECADGIIKDDDKDNDGNGLKGDCKGWNFAAQSAQEARRPYDEQGHGTHVAGIISAKRDQFGIAGISDKIKILPIKVLGNSEKALSSRLAQAILYATDRKADVINLSLGWPRSMHTLYLQSALDYARSQGVVIVAAAGNNSNYSTVFPCAYFDVICVGSVTANGDVSNFSNYGGNVDIYAPGDQIMSTIPHEFVSLNSNFKGYTVMSGTSQAAPMVSAGAALLKAINPKIEQSDIYLKLVNGVKKNKILNFENSFFDNTLTTSKSIKPIFKNFFTIIYNSQEKNFKNLLELKNFSNIDQSVQVDIKFLKNQSITNDVFSKKIIFKASQIKTVPIHGNIIDLMSDNEKEFEIKLTYQDGSVETFAHTVVFSKKITEDLNVRIHKFKYYKKQVPIGKISNDGITPFIRTVESLNKTPKLPEYYVVSGDKAKKEAKLTLFRLRSNDYYQVKKTIELEGIETILSFIKQDINYDGVDDYWLRVIVCNKLCEQGKETKKILWNFYDKELNPLFAQKSSWEYRPQYINFNLKKVQFLSKDVLGLGRVAIPYIIAKGFLPDQDQNTSFWSPKDREHKSRIYYFLPSIDKAGKVTLNTRSMNFQTDKELTQWSAIDSYPFLTDNFKKEIAYFLLRKGQGLDAEFSLLSIDKNKTKLETLNFSNFLVQKMNLVPFQTLDPTSPMMTLYDPFHQDQLRVYPLSANHEINSTELIEHKINKIGEIKENFIQGFFFDNFYEMYFRSNQNLLFLRKEAKLGKTKMYKRTLKEVSFVDGRQIKELYFPITYLNNSKLSSALYIDLTLLTDNQIFLSTFDKKKKMIIQPLQYSVVVPNSCAALNPSRPYKDNSYAYTLVCYQDDSWFLSTLKLEN